MHRRFLVLLTICLLPVSCAEKPAATTVVEEKTDPSTGWFSSGLLGPSLSLKPAYHAYLVASDYLGASRYLGPASGYPAGVEGHAFHRSATDERVDVIWSLGWEAREVALPAGASAYDPYGQLIASSGTIVLERSPVYVVARAAP